MDSRLDELNWLYKLWEERGLVSYNGLLYKLTSAGEFWTVNITQSTLEAMEYILTGKNSFALESVAAQDTKTTSKENPNQEVRGIGQGKANAMKWLNENPAKSNELEAKLRAELVANPEQALMADIEQSNDDAESDF